MEVWHSHCAGLDVHKKTVFACRMYPDSQGQVVVQVPNFRICIGELLALSDWLREVGVTHVAMQSTGRTV
jgi:transposase